MRQVYLDMILMIERLHRQFLEVVKAELDRLGVEDINNVQALILSHVGEEEVTVGELTYRGYYLGSNVSYNVKKMVENNYLIQERSAHDRRSVRVRVSEKGLKICQHIQALYDRHVEALGEKPWARPTWKRSTCHCAAWNGSGPMTWPMACVCRATRRPPTRPEPPHHRGRHARA